MVSWMFHLLQVNVIYTAEDYNLSDLVMGLTVTFLSQHRFIFSNSFVASSLLPFFCVT